MTSAGVSVCLGIAAGFALSLGLNRVISSWIGTTTNHLLIALSVAFLLLGVAGIACLVPARRALSVDPMISLRCV
jgi:ABC-type antimicrobial peptide transport system permease subunit